MNTHAITPPRWITAADAVDTTPADLFALGVHVDCCNGCRGRWFTLRCAVDTAHDFVAGHFITTLLIAGAVIGLAVIAL
jgi:hypothetical protein